MSEEANPMSEEANTPDAEALAAVQLEGLKGTATRLGIQFHPSIGAEKLAEKIKAKMDEPSPSGAPGAPGAGATLPREETTAEMRLRVMNEATALIRVRITNMNPNKKNIEGEIFTGGNSITGSIKKYVPFGAEDGWHVPQILLNIIKERKCQVFETVSGKNGAPSSKRAKLVNEFNVEILPPLTKQEIKDLAQRQAMAGGL